MTDREYAQMYATVYADETASMYEVLDETIG